MRRILGVFVMALATCAISQAEDITVATYNIELFHQRFSPTSQPISNPEVSRRLRAGADKDLWMISQVILDPKLNPDIICIEECCEQNELEKFNTDWLKNAYETVIVFPTNTERHQTLGMMLKHGFKVLERKELEDGYAFRFAGSDAVLDELNTFIQSERQCCPFFTFGLSVSGEPSEAWLALTGPEGVKEVIREELGLISE